jgi:ribosome maturation factor RimP
MSEAVVARVTAMVAPLVADLKLDLYDLEYRGGVLRITVDTPVGSAGGVTLDDIALLTRMIGRDFDHDDPMPGHYTLEVTSPGLERTLRTPTHFQREIGKLVNLRLRDVAAGDRRVQGVLVGATDDSAIIRLDELSPDGELVERAVPYAQIDRAKTVFVWGPAPKPGKGPAKQAGSGKTGPKSSATSGSAKAGSRGSAKAGAPKAGAPKAGSRGAAKPAGPSDEVDAEPASTSTTKHTQEAS